MNSSDSTTKGKCPKRISYILLKLRKVNGAWSTCKTILGWITDTTKQVLTPPSRKEIKLKGYLDVVNPKYRLCLITSPLNTTAYIYGNGTDS